MIGIDSDDKYYTKALGNGLKILFVFSGSEEHFSVQDLSIITGIDRATVHRAVYTLEKEGYLEGLNGSGKYCLGKKLLILGQKYSQSHQLLLCAKKHMHMIALNHNLSVCLATEDEGYPLLVEKVDPPGDTWISAHVGRKMSNTCTAMGKVLLTAYRDDELEAYFAEQDFVPMTDKSIVNLFDLKTELASVKELGYALSLEEMAAGQGEIAVPIYDGNNQLVAAMGVFQILSPQYEEVFVGLKRDLLRAAVALSQELGYQGEGSDLKYNLK